MTHQQQQQRGRQKFRKPFTHLKNIFSRKLKIDRSPSRERSTSCPKLSSFVLLHPHNVASTDTPKAPLYLQLNINSQGSILRPDRSSKLGLCLCSCGRDFSNPHINKNVTFSTKVLRNTLPDEHFCSSSFLVPELPDAFTRTNKSTPIFYRVDLAFPDSEIGHPLPQDVTYDNLKNAVHSELSRCHESFAHDQVEHVYERLFNVPAKDITSHDNHGRDDDHDQHQQPTAPPPPPNLFLSPNDTSHLQGNGQLGLLIVRTSPQVPWTFPLIYETPSQVSSFMGAQANIGILAVYISRDVFNSRFHFYISIPPHFPNINPSCPFQVSPDSYTIYTLTHQPLEPLMETSPKLSIPATSINIAWYNNVYESIINKTLFSSPPPRATNHDADDGHDDKDGHNDNDSDNDDFGDNGSDKVSSLSMFNDFPTSHHAQPPPITPVEIYLPPILTQSSCPKYYQDFWSLKATPRKITKGKAPKAKHVAPRFPKKMQSVALQINFPHLLTHEFESYAKAYQAICEERHVLSVENADSIVQLSIINDASVLANKGLGKVLEDLRKNSPRLREQKLENLSEASLQSFFFQARTYMLSNSIPYWSFSDYFLNPRNLGDDIYNKVMEILLGYPSYKSTLKQFSCFIEQSIRKILPLQESYTDFEERVIDTHRSFLLSSTPSVDHTKISLQNDAQEAVIKSPYFKQHQSTISEELKRHLIEAEKSNLLYKIVSNTVFEKELIQLLIANDRYASLDIVPYPVLISNLENLILVSQKTESLNSVNSAKSTRNSRPLKAASKGILKQSLSRSKSPNNPNRTRSNSGHKSPKLMEKCDNCLVFEFDKGWCRQNKHCRVSGHQYQPRTKESIQQMRNGDQSSFTFLSNCPKCPPQPQTPPSSSHHAPHRAPPSNHAPPNQLYDPYRPPPSQPRHQKPPSRSPSRYQQPR